MGFLDRSQVCLQLLYLAVSLYGHNILHLLLLSWNSFNIPICFLNFGGTKLAVEKSDAGLIFSPL